MHYLLRFKSALVLVIWATSAHSYAGTQLSYDQVQKLDSLYLVNGIEGSQVFYNSIDFTLDNNSDSLIYLDIVTRRLVFSTICENIKVRDSIYFELLSYLNNPKIAQTTQGNISIKYVKHLFRTELQTSLDTLRIITQQYYSDDKSQAASVIGNFLIARNLSRSNVDQDFVYLDSIRSALITNLLLYPYAWGLYNYYQALAYFHRYDLENAATFAKECMFYYAKHFPDDPIQLFVMNRMVGIHLSSEVDLMTRFVNEYFQIPGINKSIQGAVMVQYARYLNIAKDDKYQMVIDSCISFLNSLVDPDAKAFYYNALLFKLTRQKSFDEAMVIWNEYETFRKTHSNLRWKIRIPDYQFDIYLGQKRYQKLITYYESLYSNMENDKDIPLENRIQHNNGPLVNYKNYENLMIGPYYYHWKNTDDISSLRKSYELQKILTDVKQNSFEKATNDKLRELCLLDANKELQNFINIGYDLWKSTHDIRVFEELTLYLEQHRGNIFRTIVAEQLAMEFAGVPEHLVKKELKMRKELEKKRLSLGGDAFLSNVKETREFLQYASQYDSLKRHMNLNYPVYNQLNRKRIMFDLNELQGAVDSNEAILSYFLSYNAAFLFYIDADTMDVVYTDIVYKDFKKDLEDYYLAVSTFSYQDYSAEKFDEFVKTSKRLYNILIQPFEKNMIGKSLFVLPEKELSLVSFDMLLTDTVADLKFGPDAYKSLPYLIKRQPISVLYTIEQLLYCEHTPKINPVYRGFAPVYDKPVALNKLYDFPALIGTIDETMAGRKYFGGKVYKRRRATIKRLFDEACKNDILHLAVHAVADNREPAGSFMQFAGKEGENTLAQYDLYGKEFETTHLILSGCSTGAGRIQLGEGVLNLARAFFMVNVKNIIISYWPISDRSGTVIMENYFQYLSEGYRSDSALQKAKIQYINNCDMVDSHPFYWANYQVVGEPVKFIITKDRWFTIIKSRSVYGAMVLLFMVIIFVSLRRLRS